MKLAVLADIHANLPAFHAVIEDVRRWKPDLVIVAGDIINRGAQPAECLELALELAAREGWRLIRGNHERYVLQFARDQQRPDFQLSGPRFEIVRPVAWTHRQVAGQIDTIAALPEQLRIDVDGEALVVYHASIRHDRDGITARSSENELREQIDPRAALFCVGHTHVPVVRRLDRTLVVNAGSVGLPFDGDLRPAYARISRAASGWEAEVVRLPYDHAAALQAFLAPGVYDELGALAPLMLRELETGESLIYSFVPEYHDRINAGAISLEAAVQAYLAR